MTDASEATKFDATVRKLLSVSHDELKRPERMEAQSRKAQEASPC
jgi:hypothetical protein